MLQSRGAERPSVGLSAFFRSFRRCCRARLMAFCDVSDSRFNNTTKKYKRGNTYIITYRMRGHCLSSRRDFFVCRYFCAICTALYFRQAKLSSRGHRKGDAIVARAIISFKRVNYSYSSHRDHSEVTKNLIFALEVPLKITLFRDWCKLDLPCGNMLIRCVENVKKRH